MQAALTLPRLLVNLTIVLRAIAMVGLAYAGFIAIYALARAFSPIPVVGQYFAQGAEWLAQQGQKFWSQAAHAISRPVVGVFNGMASVIDRWTEAGLEAIHETGRAFRVLRWNIIPEIARRIRGEAFALFRELRAWAREAVNRLESAIAVARELIKDLRHTLWTEAIRPLRWVITVALPRVHERIDAARAYARWLVVEGVMPRLRVAEREIESLWGRTGEILRDLTQVRNWALPLIGAFAVAEVISLLQHVRHCRPSTRFICSIDMPDLEDLLGVLFLMLSMREIVIVVRESVSIADEVADIAREMIRE